MEILVISGAEVRRLLPLDDCIEIVHGALVALSAGDALMPLRTATWMPSGSALATMPCFLPGQNVFGVKIISVFPENRRAALDSHQGGVLLFEAEHGVPLALVEASEVTAVRTGAASALATRLLAREDAGDLAILGSGAQAAVHVQAMAAVRRLRSLVVWSRTPAHARDFAREWGERLQVPAVAVETPEKAVRRSDLVCTVTPAMEPILLGEWLGPGTHLNAVGFNGPASREIDTEAVRRARLYVDRRESTLNEAGEFLEGLRVGAFTEDHILGELGELAAGRMPGRRDEGEITLFRSLGVAVEDLAAAVHVYRRAKAEGVGIRAPLGTG
jgi:ornithine cyclodeaminase/alanine dehydrogenase-like protein (mu-crystallin family)